MIITPFDMLVVALVLISALLAALRGFTREMLSILSWVVALLIAYYLYDDLLPFTLPYSEKISDNTYLGIFVSAFPIFLLTLILVSYATVRISNFILESAIGALDRSLGFIFGAVRGILLAVVALIFFNFLVAPTLQPEWIAKAKTKPFLEHIGMVIVDALPENAGQNLLDKIDGSPSSIPNET